MQAPLLPIDADGRFQEVLPLAQGDVYQLSDQPEDNTNPSAIDRSLNQNMPGSGVNTIVVDSLTAIIAPLVTKAVQDNDAGRNKNRMSGFKEKALAMRQLQDVVTRWGVDTLWIYHLQDGMDGNAKNVTTATLSATERARLYRSLNLELHVVEDEDRRGIKVVWARRGRSGITLWDETGQWTGMPERIEAAVYDGLTEAEQQAIEGDVPLSFPNPEAAIAWGVDSGAFEAIEHARNAYAKLKREKKPGNAVEMRAFWVEDVQRRLDQADEPVGEQELLF